MQGLASTSVRRHLGSTLTGVLACALLAAGCNESSKNPVSPAAPAPVPTRLTGPFISGSATGVVAVTIPPASSSARFPARAPAFGVSAVSGTLQPDGGDTIALSGTYDAASTLLQLSGSGYSLNGNVESIQGTPFASGGWTGPSGPGTFGCVDPSASTHAAAYRGSIDIGTTPTWNISLFIVGNSSWGDVAPAGGGSHSSVIAVLSGPYEARQISIQASYTKDGHGYSIVGSGGFNGAASEIIGKWGLFQESQPTGDGGNWSATEAP